MFGSLFAAGDKVLSRLGGELVLIEKVKPSVLEVGDTILVGKLIGENGTCWARIEKICPFGPSFELSSGAFMAAGIFEVKLLERC